MLNETVADLLRFSALAAALSLFFLFSEENRAIAERLRFALGILLLGLGVSLFSAFPDAVFGMAEALNEAREEADAVGRGATEEFSPLAEEAYLGAVRDAVCARFSLAESEVTVSAEGFDLSGMRAEKLRLLLTGKAALSDRTAVRSYVNETFGECEVEIGFG